MEDHEEDALPCGSMPRYQGYNFITEKLQQEQQEENDNANNGFFNFIPNLPLNFLFGRFSNVIPEETEDADRRLSCSPSDSNKTSISEEVKKLGLTAEIKQGNDDDKKFEPYWVEIQPKVRKGHYRHNSASHRRTEKNVKNVSSVDDNAFIEGVSKQPSGLDDPFKENLENDRKIDDIDRTDFSGIHYIPDKNSTSTALVNKDTVVYRRGEIFRRNSQDELTADLTRLRLGRLFRPKSGMKRASSAECLRKIQHDLKITDSTKYSQKDDSIVQSHTDIVLKDNSIRRTSSTGNLQRLQNINAFDSTIETSSNTDGENLQNRSEGYRDRSDSNLSEKSTSKYESEEESSTTPISGKNKSLGAQSVNWATTTKVRQTKRERNMFSPTSF